MVRDAVSDNLSEQKCKLEKLPREIVYLNNEEKDSLNPGFQMGEMDGALGTSCRKKGDDGHYYECVICDNGGDLLCCDTCPSVFHLQCLSPPLERVPAGNWNCPDCDKKDELLSLKDLKRSIKGKKSSLKWKKHSTMKSLDTPKNIILSSCPVIEEEKKALEEQTRALIPMEVNGWAWNAIPQDDRFGQDKIKRPKPCATTEAWSEEELDALWIGVRRHGAGNWHTMLVDSMMKCLLHRTSESLSERWKIEKLKILDLEKSQAPLNAAVKPRKSLLKQMVPAGDYNQAKRPNGFLKIYKPQKSFGRSLITTQTKNFQSKFYQSNPPLIKKNQLDKKSRKKQSHVECNAEKGIERRDDSATESELSLKEWCEGKEVSSEGTISD